MCVCVCVCVCHYGQVTLLKKLRALCLEDDPQVAVTIRKLSMVSMMTVLKDLVPRWHFFFFYQATPFLVSEFFVPAVNG